MENNQNRKVPLTQNSLALNHNVSAASASRARRKDLHHRKGEVEVAKSIVFPGLRENDPIGLPRSKG